MSEKIIKRCDWLSNDPLYIKYHDEEWGVPVYDDKVLFELLVLESFQAGLSWLTILKKREGFRKAFDQFDYQKISQYNEATIQQLLEDTAIIRHRKKIEATIINAQLFMEIQKEFGSFSEYLWKYVDYKPLFNKFQNIAEVPAKTQLSDTISKDLKKRGFKFLGSTTVYAYLQGIGVVNDHVAHCFKFSTH